VCHCYSVILVGTSSRIVTALISDDLDQLSPVAHPPLLHLGVRVIVAWYNWAQFFEWCSIGSESTL